MKNSETKNAEKPATKILVDYFCFSVSVEDFLGYKSENYDFTNIADRIEKKFLLAGLPFEERRGLYGYNFCRLYCGILYAWGGQGTVYIQMSGSGCRTMETHHPGWSWESWIRQLQATYGSLHFSRLDIACDTFQQLDIKQIQRSTRREQFISRWKTYLVQEGTAENSVIWGSSKSDFRLRIYDKTQERQRVVADPDEVPKGWVRAEFQFRNEACMSFIRPWQQSQNISTTYFGLMRNQLLYVSSYDLKNRLRAKLFSWWDLFLGNAGQIKMSYPGGQEYNLKSLERYLFLQAGSSLKAYLTYTDGDIEPLMVGIEHCKINDRQKEMLNQEVAKHQKMLQEAILYAAQVQAQI